MEVARKELPGLMEEVEKLMCAEEVGETLQYYQQVWRFLHSYERKEEEGKEGEEGDEKTTEFFPVLSKVRQGEKLLVVDGEGDEAGEEGQGVVEIDWGAEMSSASAEGATIEGGGGGIDWGEGGEGGPEEAAHEVECDFMATNGSSTSPPPVTAAAMPKTGVDGQGGSILGDATLRAELLNELVELKAFLRQRRVEVGDTDNVVFVGQYHGAHAALQQQSVSMVDRYLNAIKLALGGLREKRPQQLWLVCSSPVYVERMVQGLRQHRRRVRKLDMARWKTEGRREEAVEALARAVPEYEAMAAATKALKRKVEVSLRELFKDRNILITGGVNTL